MTTANDLTPETMSALDEEDKELTKDEHAINFAKVLKEIDKCMEPFKEHRHDLKNSYAANGWLTKSEMTAIAKAYRALKSEDDLEEVLRYVNLIK